MMIRDDVGSGRLGMETVGGTYGKWELESEVEGGGGCGVDILTGSKARLVWLLRKWV
jgi:hypothetical protein